jgi:hypothetical protein
MVVTLCPVLIQGLEQRTEGYLKLAENLNLASGGKRLGCGALKMYRLWLLFCIFY